MKALSIETIMTNLTRFNSKIELKPGQIFSGKVLALYPNDMAKIQLAGKNMTAQLMTGLSLGEKYWFQVKPNSSGSVPLLQVIEGAKGTQTPPPQSIGIRKLNPQLRLLVEALSREQLPMTKETIGKAEQWLAQVSSNEKGIQAIKTMVLKNLPQTDGVFKALYHAQSSTPMSAEIDDLMQLLQQQRMSGNEKAINNVTSAIQTLKTSITPLTNLQTVKHLFMMYQQPDTSLAVKQQIQDLFQSLKLPLPTQHNDQQSTVKGTTLSLPTDEMLLQSLKLNMSPRNAEVYLREQFSQLNQTQMSNLKQLTQTMDQKPQFSLIEMVKGLGLSLEKDLISHQIGELQRNPSLKSALLELLNQELPSTIRDKAESLMHRLTGQQLLHTSENQSLMTLFYQMPIHFKEWKSDLMMRWDLKQNQSGEIDEDYSRILFYLDLQHLNETVIDMNVQNRVISLKIVNDQMHVNQLIPPFKEMLKERLVEHGYTLSTIKVEQSVNESKKHLNSTMMEASIQGVDLSI
ncbi:hypothetical protein ACSVDE_05455 [Pseudalkalibacillus sp. Hm43]|uniref:hypothetical protein n=1 Tax=Pseudalkalibacillus sp. Hm43 TaxID=3450742 RepID=UPI003F443E3F